MGAPMARHLAQAGHDLIVFNRSSEKAHIWVASHGGKVAATPAEGARSAEYVIACVGCDEDVEAITLGADGAFAAMREGALFIDHTTVSPGLARRLAQAGEERRLQIVDAPISGGQAGAEQGTLAIMCGGSDEALAAADPILSCYGRKIVHVGPAGHGQAAKLANQLCIAGTVQGLAEAVHFARAAGLDLDKVLEALSGGAAASWQMANRWPTMAKGEFDFGFAVDWMRKDLGLALEEARANKARLPLAALVDQFYADLQAIGAGRQDTSALLRRFEV